MARDRRLSHKEKRRRFVRLCDAADAIINREPKSRRRITELKIVVGVEVYWNKIAKNDAVNSLTRNYWT